MFVDYHTNSKIEILVNRLDTTEHSFNLIYEHINKNKTITNNTYKVKENHYPIKPQTHNKPTLWFVTITYSFTNNSRDSEIGIQIDSGYFVHGKLSDYVKNKYSCDNFSSRTFKEIPLETYLSINERFII